MRRKQERKWKIGGEKKWWLYEVDFFFHLKCSSMYLSIFSSQCHCDTVTFSATKKEHLYVSYVPYHCKAQPPDHLDNYNYQGKIL